MNKTVNINIGGTFFHIDENAFGKLQRYLEAIRKSLSDPQGSDEIMRDIEARIAELFSEKLQSSTQVVTLKELDEVIAVMGQPEDYMVDEEIFDDAPPSGKAKSTRSGYKQLYRDVDNKFIAGVSGGLAHYLGIDSLWIRLIWILLTLFSSGFFIVIYILFWILVPAAESTSDKLKMSGEPVNISNIEKKLKEELDNAAEKVKNADYDEAGKRVKKGASGFFDTLGSIILTLLKIFVKFLGILLIIISLSTLVGLIVGLFTLGSVGFWGTGEIVDYISLVDTTNAPIWLISLLVLFAVGIPFFVLFILGLKLLIDNLKSIGLPAKVVLFAVWIMSIVGLGILGVRQATETAFQGEYIDEQTLDIRTGDTLRLAMNSDDPYEYSVRRRGGLQIKYDGEDNRLIYSNDIRVIVRSTRDSVAKMIIEKKADGQSFQDARDRAEAIDYNHSYANGSLLLDGYFTTDFANKYRDQEIEVILYLPVGSIIYADDNTYSYHRNDSWYRDILHNGDEEKYLMVLEDRTECIDCPEHEKTDWEKERDARLENGDVEGDDTTEEVEEGDTTEENVSEDTSETDTNATETDSTEINAPRINDSGSGNK